MSVGVKFDVNLAHGVSVEVQLLSDVGARDAGGEEVTGGERFRFRRLQADLPLILVHHASDGNVYELSGSPATNPAAC